MYKNNNVNKKVKKQIIRGTYMKDLSMLYKTDYKGVMNWNEFLKKVVKGKKDRIIDYVNEIKDIHVDEFENGRNKFIKNVMKDYANLGTYCTIPMEYNNNKNKKGKSIIKKEYYTIPYSWLLDNNNKMSFNNISKKLKQFEKHPENFKNHMILGETNKKLNDIHKNLLSNVFNGSDTYTGGVPNYSGATFSGSSVLGMSVNIGAKTTIFNQINKDYEKDCCFYNSMKYLNMEKEEYKKIKTFEEICEVLNNLDINYAIFNNYFEFNKKNIMDNQGERITYKDNIYTKINIKPKVIKRNIKDKEKFKNYIFAITLDSNVNHIFIPNDEVNNFFVNSTYSKIFVQQDEKLKEYNKIKSVEVKGYRYIYYDLETIMDFKINGFFREVSISLSYVDVDETITNFFEDDLIKTLKKNCQFYLNDNLNIFELIKNMMHPNKNNKIISFNGAKFDNIFLLQSMKNNKYEPCIMVNNGMIEISNNKLSSLIFSTHDIIRFIQGKLSEISINFIKNEELRKVKRCDLFEKMQELYENNELYKDKNFYEELKKYNDLDIISLCIIQYNFYKELKNVIKCDFIEEEIINCVSIPQYIYKLFTKNIQSIKNKPKKFTESISNKPKKEMNKINNKINKLKKIYIDEIKNIEELKKNKKFVGKEQYNKLRNAKENFLKHVDENKKNNKLSVQNILEIYNAFHVKKTGGRCQSQNKYIVGYGDEIQNNNDLKTKFINEDICLKSMDVASLYPFVMCIFYLSYYMSGDLIFTTEYVKNKLGVYFIDITQNLKENEQVFYCEKSKEGNDWNVDGKKIENVIMTSVEYEEILINKPHWDITIKYGFYTEEKICGYDLFNVIIPFLREKTKQDELKCIKSKDYNPAMRETCKTICNSLSGKFLQQFKQIEYQILNFEIITVNKEEENKEEFLKDQLKRDKIIHVGLFIYSISKIFMYKYMYGEISNNNFNYTDTDSYKFVDKKSFDLWEKKYGNIQMKKIILEQAYNDKQLGYDKNTKLYFNGEGVKKIGQFEDEYNNKNFNRAIYLDKKEYITYSTNKKTLKDSKIMFKGVSKDFIILNNNDNDINVKFRKKHTKDYININEYNNLDNILKENYEPELNISDLVYNSYYTNQKIEKMFKNITEEQQFNNFEKLFINKALGKKTPILMRFFNRDIIKKSIRKEYIIKLI